MWAAHWYDYSSQLGFLPVFVSSRLLFAGTGLLAAGSLAWLANEWRRLGNDLPLWIPVVLTTLVFGMTLSFGHRLFDSLDGGFVTDLAWRIHLGQRPFLDFPCTTPPFFNEFCRLAWGLGVTTWSALVAAWSVWGLALLGLLYFFLKPAGIWAAVLGSSLVAGSCLLLHSYAFYNPMGWGFFCVALAGWYGAELDAKSVLRRLAFGVILGLGLFQKPNLWPAWFLLLLAYGWARGWRTFFWGVLVAGIIAGSFIWIGKIPVLAYLDCLWAVSGTRGSLLHSPVVLHPPLLDLLLAAGVSASLGLAWLSFPGGRNRPGVVAWCAAAWAAGALGFFLNAEMRLVDLTPPALAATLLFLHGSAAPRGRWRWVAGTTIALFFFLSGTLLGWQRVRVPASASFSLDPRESLTTMADGVLAGTRVQKDIRQMADDLQSWSHLRGQTGLFLGPTVEWAYPDFQSPSPLGLPVNWAIGTMVWDLNSARQNWRNARFQWLILHRERPLPEEINAIVRESYVLEATGQILDLYRRIP